MEEKKLRITEQNNTEFGWELNDACKTYLKDGIDVDRYVNMTLDKLWCTYMGRYETLDGDPWYYEIPSRDSKDNRPHVVHLMQEEN